MHDRLQPYTPETEPIHNHPFLEPLADKEAQLAIEPHFHIHIAVNLNPPLAAMLAVSLLANPHAHGVGLQQHRRAIGSDLDVDEAALEGCRVEGAADTDNQVVWRSVRRRVEGEDELRFVVSGGDAGLDGAYADVGGAEALVHGCFVLGAVAVQVLSNRMDTVQGAGTSGRRLIKLGKRCC